MLSNHWQTLITSSAILLPRLLPSFLQLTQLYSLWLFLAIRQHRDLPLLLKPYYSNALSMLALVTVTERWLYRHHTSSRLGSQAYFAYGYTQRLWLYTQPWYSNISIVPRSNELQLP